MPRFVFLLVAASLACGGSEAPAPPHDSRFDACVKLGAYRIETSRISASGNNCNAPARSYPTELVASAGEGLYTFKYYWPTPTLGCLVTFQVDPSNCSANFLRTDCARLGIQMTGGWSPTSTGFSGTIAAEWNYSASNHCTESETWVATLTE